MADKLSYEKLEKSIKELEANQGLLNKEIERLKKNETKFRTIFSNLQDIYLESDLGGTILEISPSIEQFSKYTRGELIGRLTTDVYSSPEDREKFLAIILKTGQVREFETWLADKDNTQHFFSVNSLLVRDLLGNPEKIIHSMHNITSRKKSESDLKASQGLLFTILDSIDATIYVADLKTHEILFMNTYMMDVFGSDLTGTTCYKTLRNQSSVCSFCTNEKLFDKNNRPSGIYKWEDLNPVTGRWSIHCDRAIKWIDGRYVRFQMAMDISEIKTLQKEQARTQTRLHQAQKMEAIGTLAGGIAHDFNNILSAVMGFAQLAHDETREGTVLRDDIQEILKASNRAKDLVGQILAFSRQEEGTRNIPIRVSTIARESIKLLRASIPASVTIEDNIISRSTILADPSQIHQIFMNLCTNAAQAMEDTGLLTISLEDVALDADFARSIHGISSGEYLQLTVADTGIGISPDLLGTIFDPYFTTKKMGEGTGLGLSTVHGIVKSCGGAIKVESKQGQGSIFKVYFPRIQAAHKSKELKPIDIPSGNEKILFVDDELPIIKMTGKMLESLGYTVTSRASSLEALELFNSNPDRFDLLITDMTMPSMTGDRLAQKIMEIRPGFPVILCTGFNRKISQARAEKIGIKAFMLKPFNKEDLAIAIRDVLDNREKKNIKGRILVVDDDPQIRLLLKQMLEKEGLGVVTASNGRQGSEFYRESPADLIITDIVMPEKEGIEMIRELKKDFPGLKIIAISGGGKIDPEIYLKMAGLLGAAKTFTKPFDINRLIDSVKLLLQEEKN